MKRMLPLLTLIFVISHFKSQQLNQYISGNGSDGQYLWKSTSDFIPQYPVYDSSNPFDSGYGKIKLGQQMSIEFDFLFHGRTEREGNCHKLENFFRIGQTAWFDSGCGGEGSQYPSFSLAAFCDADILEIGYRTETRCPDTMRLTDYAQGSLSTTESHHIKITMNNSLIMVEITGGGQPNFVQTQERTETRVPDLGVEVPIWFMSNRRLPNQYNLGNATFSNIKISSSVFVTGNPTSSPTLNPTTAAPTDPPSSAPTRNPTASPSNAPSIAPTLSPSRSPTKSPSNAPSFSPTISPSNAPTSPPSRAPTSLSDYDSFMDINYAIRRIDWREVETLANKHGDYTFNETVNADIINMIESAYTNLDLALHFKEFYVRIESVNDFEVSYLTNRERPDIILTESCWTRKGACTLRLQSKLFCDSTICQYIFDKFENQKKDFERFVSVDLIEYVYPNESISDVDTKIYFVVESMGKPGLIHPVEAEWFTQFENWIIIFVGIVIIIVVVMIFYFKHRIKKMRNMKAFIVQNPLVLLVSIGEYERDIVDVQRNEINVHISNLDGIEKDVKHMTELFEERLCYDVFPKMVANKYRTKWKEKEFKEFIEERSKYLADNIDDGKKYDSLVLIISCHGIKDYLLMSDHRKYSKLAAQRTFSYWSKSRQIPRFILFDCCSGPRARKDQVDIKKKVSERDIFGGVEDGKWWLGDDENPDHLTARVNAANAGFTSNLNTETGSYLIFKMYQKYKDALDGKRSPFPFIHEIFDEIQTELQKDKKQLPESVWNDGTRYLVFKKRDGASSKQRSAHPIDAFNDNDNELHIVDKSVETELQNAA